MYGLLNKTILFVLCMLVFLPVSGSLYAVAWMILAVMVTALNEYLGQDKVKIILFLAYSALCIFIKQPLCFLPLICYDIGFLKPKWVVFLAAVPLALQVSAVGPLNAALIAVYCALACLMKYQTTTQQRLRSEFISLRDSAKELSTSLQEKNRALLEKQDYEVNLATLRERNRISREIHDTVGHLLSSAILQIGALLATSRDKAQLESLGQLKDTLSKGMDSVRQSVHDLHDESVDLLSEAQALVNGFRFCPAALEYDVQESPERAVKYAFIAILKESLSNVSKHSNATQVQVIIREHPALYQLIVRDNGSMKSRMNSEGLGLKNIRDRVESLGGILHITNENGFELFISVPKGLDNETAVGKAGLQV